MHDFIPSCLTLLRKYVVSLKRHSCPYAPLTKDVSIMPLKRLGSKIGSKECFKAKECKKIFLEDIIIFLT